MCQERLYECVIEAVRVCRGRENVQEAIISLLGFMKKYCTSILYWFKIRHSEAMKRHNLLPRNIFQSMNRLYRFKIRHYKAIKRHNSFARNKLQSMKRL